MGKKIKITENVEQRLIKLMLSENFFYPNPDKVLVVKKYLDVNFIQSAIDDISSSGLPTKSSSVNMKNQNGQVINTISLGDLFYMIQEKFKNIENDKSNRDLFLKQVINDWYNKKISREGGLSVNYL